MTYGYKIAIGILVAGVIGCMDATDTTAYRDQKITEDVEQALRGQPGSIQVSTRDRVVSLDGSVPDSAARERAAQIAMDVDGVARVTNNLRASVAADAPADAPAGLPPVNRGGVPPGNRPPAPELQ